MDTIGGNAIVDVLVFAVFVVARVIAVVAVVVATTTTTCTYVYLPWVGGMGVRSVQGSRYEECQLLSIYMPKWRFFLPSIQRFAKHFAISHANT